MTKAELIEHNRVLSQTLEQLAAWADTRAADIERRHGAGNCHFDNEVQAHRARAEWIRTIVQHHGH